MSAHLESNWRIVERLLKTKTGEKDSLLSKVRVGLSSNQRPDCLAAQSTGQCLYIPKIQDKNGQVIFHA